MNEREREREREGGDRELLRTFKTCGLFYAYFQGNREGT